MDGTDCRRQDRYFDPPATLHRNRAAGATGGKAAKNRSLEAWLRASLGECGVGYGPHRHGLRFPCETTNGSSGVSPKKCSSPDCGRDQADSPPSAPRTGDLGVCAGRMRDHLRRRVRRSSATGLHHRQRIRHRAACDRWGRGLSRWAIAEAKSICPVAEAATAHLLYAATH